MGVHTYTHTIHLDPVLFMSKLHINLKRNKR